MTKRVYVFECRGFGKGCKWFMSSDHAPFTDSKLAADYAKKISDSQLTYRAVAYVKEARHD